MTRRNANAGQGEAKKQRDAGRVQRTAAEEVEQTEERKCVDGG